MLRLKLRQTSLLSRALIHSSFTRGFSNHSRRLDGKVALITGAASGIGKATTAKFLENGAKVVMADIQDQLGQDIAKQLGSNVSFVKCDVAKESDVSRAVDFAVSQYGQLDIMYNNAGAPCKTSPNIVDLDLAQFDQVMSINARGVLLGVKHASRVMIPKKRGTILCTASVTGIMGGISLHSYSISKSTVISIVKTVSAELSRHGIRLNCISPYVIPTKFVMEELRMMYPTATDEMLVKMVHSTGELKGENCEEVDVANATVYLASDEAKYVTGHNLVVDGGYTSFKHVILRSPDQV